MSIIIETAFKTSIDIPYGELKNVISWCQHNCQSDWRFQESLHAPNAGYSSLPYNFFFETEKDYVSFVIWKK